VTPAKSQPGSFGPKDFASLALSLRHTVANHRVPPELRASLIEDVVFHVAVFIDEKTGSDFHESIFAVLRKHARQLDKAPAPSDPLLAEVEIIFRKGRKAELNVLRSCLAKPANLRLNLEIALGVRDVTDIKARVDTEQRFTGVWKTKGGIKAVRIRKADVTGKSTWREVELPRSVAGRLSVKALMELIMAEVIRVK